MVFAAQGPRRIYRRKWKWNSRTTVMRIEQTRESRARRRCRSSSLTPDNPATKYTRLECGILPFFSPTISVDAARKSKNGHRLHNRVSPLRLDKHLYKLRVCSLRETVQIIFVCSSHNIDCMKAKVVQQRWRKSHKCSLKLLIAFLFNL